MAISPGGVFPCGRPRAIEQTRLRQQYKWTIGVPARPHCLFRLGNLFEAPTQMHRRRSRAIPRFPRNRCVQRVVHFECCGTIPVSHQQALVALSEFVSSNLEELPRSHVTKQ